MMPLPINKFSLLAALWLAAGTYSLIFREAEGGASPFAHFDKVAHFALFFGQFWLAAKAYIHAQQAIPYRALFIIGFILATASEYTQAAFTATRQGSIADGIADLLGCAVALWVAAKQLQARQLLKESSSQ